jgi:hypothetical protein
MDGIDLMERLRAACFAISLMLLLAGCSGNLPDPVATPSVLAGTWVADGPGSSEGWLELNSDGSVTAESLPKQVVLGPAGEHWFDPIDWSDLTNLAGEWRVQANEGDAPYIGISLTEPVDGRPGFNLYVQHEGDEWILYYKISGEDTGQTLDFHRTTG